MRVEVARMLFPFGLTLSWIVIPLNLFCQNPDATWSCDTLKIRIGEQIECKLQVSGNKPLTVFWPVLGETEGIEAIDSRELEKKETADSIWLEKYFVFTSFDTGYQVLEPLKISVQYGKNGLDTLMTRPLMFRVHPIAVDTTQQFKDIAAPISVGYHWTEFWYIYAALLVLILAFILWKLLSKRPRELTLLKSTEPQLPPHLWALGELNKLESEKLWQNQDIKAYHARISLIMREYLELRYGIPALESTTHEILMRLKSAGVLANIREGLERVLILSDFVKFAKWKPVPDEHEQSLRLSREFVHHTTPETEGAIKNSRA